MPPQQACPPLTGGGCRGDTGPVGQRRKQEMGRTEHPLPACSLWQLPWSQWILEKSDHCRNLSLRFNTLLSVMMQSFWETQYWQLKIKQQRGNSETNSSAPIHPSHHTWSPRSPVVLSPDPLSSSGESCAETTCKGVSAERYHPQHLPVADAELQ